LWSVPRNTLFLLSFLALVILFLATSFAVKAFRAKEREVAQKWYTSGERELTSGRPEAALEDFRSALVYSRSDSHIELRLAHTLAAAGHFPEARAYLLSLWEREPGSGTVNLELARLEAHSGSASQAVQYYHNAVDGQWEENPAEHRRQARLELADFLLKAGQEAQAQAELIALAADLPRDPALETQVGGLLLNAGEDEHAARRRVPGAVLVRADAVPFRAYLFGGCRPIQAAPLVCDAGFIQVERALVSQALDSEVIIARKPL
jgi:tetratricopeptide (TPR) repeat protein